jgi:Cu(I)/Ag(I) efflux system protein CusF
MPPMTMNFRVADPKLLDGVNVGDRVRSSPRRSTAQFTVTH